MNSRNEGPIPDLETLHERHPGSNEPICKAYAQAAAVCLSDQSEPPIAMVIRLDGDLRRRQLNWRLPDARARSSWANRDDATRDGAYSVSLATIEVELGMVALERAETQTGADYYVGLPESGLESAYRLEVSGVRTGGPSEVIGRLRAKIAQAKRGNSDKSAYACVVGFFAKMTTLSKVELDAE